MERITEYKAATIAAVFFTIYQTIQTTAGSITVGGNELSIIWIFLGETLSFIPLGILLFFLIWLSKIKPNLLFRFSLSSVLIHFLIASFTISLHAIWEVYLNSIFLGSEFNRAVFQWNFFGLLEMRGMFYMTVIGLIFAIRSFRIRQDIVEKESELRLKIQRIQLRSVAMKLNPDMIYPNLRFIRKNLDKNPEKASQMVINLSSFLRTLVDKVEKNQMLLMDNAGIFKQYMELIQLRSGLTFEIHTDLIGAETDEDEKVPSILFLIPFLESLFFEKESIQENLITSVSFEAKTVKPASHGFVIKINGIFHPEKSGNYSESITLLKHHHPYDFTHSFSGKSITIGLTNKSSSAKKSLVYA